MPLYMFGGYFYSWDSIRQISPVLAGMNLCNPLLYVMEGMHVVFMGQKDFLPFWICVITICVFVLFFAWDGIRRLKKRLDCV